MSKLHRIVEPYHVTCTGLQISLYVFLNLKAVDKQHYNGENYPKETVEAKWEQLQYYEGSQWQNSRNSQNNSDAALKCLLLDDDIINKEMIKEDDHYDSDK